MIIIAFIFKSKETDGKGKFWNGISKRLTMGREVIAIAQIDQKKLRMYVVKREISYMSAISPKFWINVAGAFLTWTSSLNWVWIQMYAQRLTKFKVLPDSKGKVRKAERKREEYQNWKTHPILGKLIDSGLSCCVLLIQTIQYLHTPLHLQKLPKTSL